MSDIDDKITRATNWWISLVVSPYVEAYNTAYVNFENVLQKQKDRNKAQAEMFVAIASIMSTSAVMAMFANYPLSRLSTRFALRALGVSNTRAVISLYRQGATDPITAFAFGKAYDLVKGYAGDKVKSTARKLVEMTVSGTSPALPLNRDKYLTRQVTIQGLVMQEFCEAVGSDHSINSKLKEQCIISVLDSPFMQTPDRQLDPNKLAPKIELSFYMDMILSSDYIMYHSPPDMRTPPSRAGGIDVLPSDMKYPKSESFARTRGYYRTVEIDRPGSYIQSRIDLLHSQIFHKPFYAGLSLPGGIRVGGDKAGELRKAESVARILSKLTRPATVRSVMV